MRLQTVLVKAVFGAGLLALLAIPACSNDAPPKTGTICGGSPNLGEHRDAIKAALNFDALVPTYLPATTSAIPEPTINLPDDVTILFAPCPDATSNVLGPQIIVDETTQPGSPPEPGYSDPSTERVQVQGTSVLVAQGGSGDTALLGISWQQAGLSLHATFMWAGKDGPPPEITAEMRAEALRVVESIVQQGEMNQPAQ